MEEVETEIDWLRHAIGRLRTMLRYAKDPRATAVIKELIGDAETRLEKLQRGNSHRN